MRGRPGVRAPASVSCRDGYVLIEVAATLAIAGMIAALILPLAPSGTTPNRLAALASVAASLLREARTAAVARHVPVAATFDAHHRLLRAGTQSVAIPKDVDFSLLAGGNCPADGARAQVLFRPDGTNCGGILRFAKGRQVLRTRVNWADGRIDVVQGP